MFLTCPSCKTKFKVPDGAIKEAGRKVRCASCSHVWHATLNDVSDAPPAAPRAAAPTAAAAPRPAAPSAVPPEARPNPDLQNLARPTARPMPPVMPPEQAQQQTAAIRAAMMKEAGIGDEEDDLAENLLDDDETMPPRRTVDEGGAGLSDFDYEDDDADEDDDDLYADDDADDDAEQDGGLDQESKSALQRLLAGDDDDPIMQHRMKQKRDYERRKKARKRAVKSFFIFTLLLMWVGGIATFMLFPEFVKSKWPASEVLYNMLSSDQSTEDFVKEAKEKGETVSPRPTDVKQDLRLSRPEPEIIIKEGQEYLRITGWIENQGKYAITLPRIEGVLLDGSGKAISRWEVVLEAKVLARGGRIQYTSETPDPLPSNVNAVDVDTIWPQTPPQNQGGDQSKD